MQSFDFNELLFKLRYPLVILIVGLIVIGVGIIFLKQNYLTSKVEVLGETKTLEVRHDITVEIAGQVIKPGVYKMLATSRIDDLIATAGGFTKDFDKSWTDQFLNRAAKLVDGQKVFIPKADNHSNVSSAKNVMGDQTISSDFSSDSKSLININSASLDKLDTLPGIGPKYGQSIIEHRPYSTTQELVSKKILGQNAFEKIKDKISVY